MNLGACAPCPKGDNGKKSKIKSFVIYKIFWFQANLKQSIFLIRIGLFKWRTRVPFLKEGESEKLTTFTIVFSRTTGPCQQNLVESIVVWRDFKFVEIKSHYMYYLKGKIIIIHWILASGHHFNILWGKRSINWATIV